MILLKVDSPHTVSILSSFLPLVSQHQASMADVTSFNEKIAEFLHAINGHIASGGGINQDTEVILNKVTASMEKLQHACTLKWERHSSQSEHHDVSVEPKKK